VNSDY